MTNTDLGADLARFYQLRASDIKFGLETERSILSRLGNPELNWPAVHVAGSNGKGSVCAMIESILRHAGLRTGLYTSPHLIKFNERIRVNGSCVTDDDLSGLIKEVESAAKSVAAGQDGRMATFFELATAIAFQHFSRQQVQISILETGMGGRLDATNTVAPLLSVITSISLEHTDWLGKDIESIAREKCGIIKPGVPVVLGSLPRPAMGVALSIAKERRSRVILPHEIVSIQQLSQSLDGVKLKIETLEQSYGTVTLPPIGAKTALNAATAIAAVECLQALLSWEISSESVKQGLATTNWPARFHAVSRQPPVIVDGAHNPEAAKVLSDSLKTIFGAAPIGLIFGMASDKDAAGFLSAFRGLAKKCWAVPIRSERSRRPAELAALARQLGCPAETTDLRSAIDEAEDWAERTDGAVCITGSFFLAGEALELKLGPNLFS